MVRAMVTWLVAMTFALCPAPAEISGLEIGVDRDYRVGDLPASLTLTLTALDDDGEVASDFTGCATITGLTRVDQGESTPLTTTTPFVAGRLTIDKVDPIADEVTVRVGEVTATWTPELRQLPGWLSILPPLFAILLAVFLRQALLALFAGIWLGAIFVHGYNPLTALLRCFDHHLPATLTDTGHASIVVFTMALGGMVGIISKSGGTRALVDLISRRAHSRRAGMLTAWASGLVVFFDDYANCLLVGNTVRPFTDRVKVSREKLAYLVDSTAAPVATIALVSTWIGYQVGLLDDVFGAGSGYELFLDILPYSFYSFFTIAFVFMISVTLRDFGPMRRAELRAVREGLVLRPGAKPLMDRELTDELPDSARAHWMTAVVPIVAVVAFVAVGFYVSGRNSLGGAAAGASFRTIISSADSYAVLLWASFGGSIVALAMVLCRRELSVTAAVDAWVGGAKAMVMAVFILVLAWGLGAMCKNELQTGAWLLSQVDPSPHFLPIITFILSGLIALATGSSYGTMAIVIPIAGPMAWALTDDAGLANDVVWSIRHATLAAVLSGAVFGDHCSPISDTTIMSSMSSASDHVDHVRTQTPYAALCAGVAGVVGFLPAGWGVSPLYTIPVGLAVLLGLLFLLGRRVD